jgi:hypothetical protein
MRGLRHRVQQVDGLRGQDLTYHQDDENGRRQAFQYAHTLGLPDAQLDWPL